DVNADGSIIVGGGSTNLGARAFRWTQQTGMIDLGDIPGGSTESTAWAISDDGNVIAGFASGPTGTQPMRWTQATGMVGLGYLPGAPGQLGTSRGTSADGSVIVGNADLEAFRWTSATGMVRLGSLLGGGPSDAFDTSGDGSIIVGTHGSGLDKAAF